MSSNAEIGSPFESKAAKYRPPAKACDAHSHLFGPYAKYPLAGVRPFVPIESSFEAYMRMHEIIGIDRGVLVQPSHYGIDNACLFDALARGKGALKGIAVLAVESMTEKEVLRLDALGSPRHPNRAAVEIRPYARRPQEAIAERIKGVNWNIEIIPLSIDEIVALRPRLEKLPVPFVLDVLGRPQVDRGISDPTFQALLAMVRDGLLWVKLGFTEMLAPPHPYDAAIPFAAAFAEANSRRCVFGTDWPHQGPQEARQAIPDDGFLLDLFAKIVPDENIRHRIFVDNAAELYRFEETSEGRA